MRTNTCFFFVRIEILSKIFSSLHRTIRYTKQCETERKKKKVRKKNCLLKTHNFIQWIRHTLFLFIEFVQFFFQICMCVRVFAPWNFWPFVSIEFITHVNFCKIYLVKFSICSLSIRKHTQFVIVPICSIHRTIQCSCSSFFWYFTFCAVNI